MVRIIIAAALATTSFAVALESQAKTPESHKVWVDTQMAKPLQKGFKANTPSASSGLPTGKRQHKPFTVTKPVDK